ncbi:MAG: GNAT family N-acetyltransferase [Nocardioides sp.]
MAQLAVANNMFGVDEVDDLAAMFRSAVNGELPDHQWWMSVQTDGTVIAAAYVAPEPFADRLWNLYFIAVSPNAHGAGTGTQLIEHVERQLRSAGERKARVLIVETSSTDQYNGAREFYRARGFEEEARIRDFYGPGDDKVVFWKALIV